MNVSMLLVRAWRAGRPESTQDRVPVGRVQDGARSVHPPPSAGESRPKPGLAWSSPSANGDRREDDACSSAYVHDRGTADASRDRRGRHPLGAARVRDRRSRRRGRARGARAGAGGDPQLGVRVPGQANHREPRAGGRAEGRARAGPGARVRRAGRQWAAAARADWRATRCSASWRSMASVQALPGHAGRGAGDVPMRGLETLVLAGARAREAKLVDGIEVAVVERLSSAVRVLAGGPAQIRWAGRERVPQARSWRGWIGPDLSEVRGQHHAVRALVIAAAAGAHNSLLSGPPGNRQDDARPARRVDPAAAEQAGGDRSDPHPQHRGRPRRRAGQQRPFRAPHHSITTAGLVGGARAAGSARSCSPTTECCSSTSSRSSRGPPSRRCASRSRTGGWRSSRARHSAVYPARFMLVAATNPCPCGYAGEGDRCRCTESRHGAPPAPAERSAARSHRPARPSRARRCARPERHRP